MKGDSPRTIYLNQYQSPDFMIETVELEFDLRDDKTTVTSVVRFIKQAEAPLVLNGQQMLLKSVRLDGKLLSEDAYSCDEDSLTIEKVPDRFVLETVTELKPHENLSLEGLYQSSGNYCTQCEAEGFRKITYYLDRPDVMAVFTVKIIGDREQCPVMLSNGNLVEQGELDGNRHWVKWHDPHKKPSYLFALVAGRLQYIEDHYRAMDGRAICLRIYVEPENIDKCEHAMQSLKKAMQWDEQRYGLVYDLDIYMIVAVSDFNMGAMENKGLNVFNSKYVLASPDTATDADYDGIESVIAHEYFHNWTGNRVTCRDWFQLSLKEGLTVFRDQEFSADMTARAVKRIQDVRLLRAHQFAEDAGPMAHPVRPQSYVEINNFYTVTVYNKGAEVVRMYQSLFGIDGFRRGMDLYFRRHDGQAVTTDDFCAAMADANDADLEQFRRWYDQAGTPELKVTDSYDQENGVYRLHFSQSCPSTPGQTDKKPFYIPVVTALLDQQGQAMSQVSTDGLCPDADGNIVLIVKQSEQEFVFEGLQSRPVPSLLRGFSAPVKLDYPYTDKELGFLLHHDQDDFNRWEAGQNLMLKTFDTLKQQRQTGSDYSVDPLLVDTLRSILMDPAINRGVLAEILTLPSEGYLAELQGHDVDVDVIHDARDFMLRFLADSLRDELLDCYRQNTGGAEYRFSADDVASRSLKNTVLVYLMQLDDDAIYRLCIGQYRDANNMTDVMAALSCIADSERQDREQILDEFYQQWKHAPLVMDKWFSIQARSRAADTFDRVQALLQHEAFSIRNPNKVRSLLGSFTSNTIFFHRADGSGYRFIATQLLALDAFNPQVAARLLQAFSRWKRYDSKRRELMREQLQRVLSHQGLSADCYEIASKSLA